MRPITCTDNNAFRPRTNGHFERKKRLLSAGKKKNRWKWPNVYYCPVIFILFFFFLPPPPRSTTGRVYSFNGGINNILIVFIIVKYSNKKKKKITKQSAAHGDFMSFDPNNNNKITIYYKPWGLLTILKSLTAITVLLVHGPGS